MKRILFILFILFIVVLTISSQEKKTYIVKGKVNNVPDGTKVYLFEDVFRQVILDSTTIKDNEFIFKGKLEEPVMRNLKVESLGATNMENIAYISTLIVLEPGKTVELTVDDKGYYTSQSGSPLMEVHANAWRNMVKSGAPDSDGILEIIKENKDNAIGMFYFAHIIDFIQPESKSLKEFGTLFSDKRGKDKRVDEVLDYIKNLDKIAAIGTKYIDIKAKTPEGQDIALSDYVGKKDVVLLHFFRWGGLVSDKDYTYLRNAYAKYKDKGLEIVGIWCDSDTETWKEIIEKDTLTWPQMSDTNSVTQYIKTYALFDEPCTILIDKDGTIIDREIPRCELDARLSQILE